MSLQRTVNKSSFAGEWDGMAGAASSLWSVACRYAAQPDHALLVREFQCERGRGIGSVGFEAVRHRSEAGVDPCED